MIEKHDLNPNLLAAQYAVRGPIVVRAQKLEEQGKKIIYCNIGNPQALKQKPLTYIRQMLSLLEYPELQADPQVLRRYPEDIVARAHQVLKRHPEGIGAYTQSAGMPFIREAVAGYIRKRDNIPADKDQVILTDGASKGVQAVVLALRKTVQDGFMIPVPQYPLYSATITLYGASMIGYFLDEGNNWQLDEIILTESITRAKHQGANPVAIAVINPSNPTGGVLSYDNIKMIVGFAKRHRLSIMADEVYQENVYDSSCKFYSFAKVMHDLQEHDITLFSFHSVSKGFLGECGHRGGYMEFRNVSDEVRTELIKQQSISLCSNVSGQIATYMMVTPPQPGDESYPLFTAERDNILQSLKKKAEILGREINKIEGMHLWVPQGAMYAFVRFELPPDPDVDVDVMTKDERLAYEAKRDSDYCMALLEDTGICVVPGSGFGQKPGTFHFRTTFLPPLEEIEDFVFKLRRFHEKYTHAKVVS